MRLIDADALIDRLDYCVKEGMGSTIAFTFKHMVEEAPTIDIPHGDDWERYSERLWKNAYERGKADRPQGEWIESFKRVEVKQGAYTGAKFVHDGWSCSECSEVVEKRYPNCPYCLTRMKGADDE